MIKLILYSILYLFFSLIMLWIIWPVGALFLIGTPLFILEGVDDYLYEKRRWAMIMENREDDRRAREEIARLAADLGLKFKP